MKKSPHQPYPRFASPEILFATRDALVASAKVRNPLLLIKLGNASLVLSTDCFSMYPHPACI